MPNLNFYLISFFHFRSEKLAVTRSDNLAALNRKILRFFSTSYYSFCLFHKASFGSTYLVCADTISISSAEVISFPTFVFLSRNSKIFISTNINNITGSPLMHPINSSLSTIFP